MGHDVITNTGDSTNTSNSLSLHLKDSQNNRPPDSVASRPHPLRWLRPAEKKTGNAGDRPGWIYTDLHTF
jgi:hypothetical protein